jgi:hypothetical protein
MIINTTLTILELLRIKVLSALRSYKFTSAYKFRYRKIPNDPSV